MRSCFWPLLCLSLLGCGADVAAPPPDMPPERATGLGNDPIPPDFTFQATRPVEVEMITEAGGGETEPGASRRYRLEVRTPSGDLIYRGSINGGDTFRFDFPLAPDTTSLEFTMIDEVGTRTVRTVPVDPTQAGVAIVLGGA
jgi:hypothetical protein